MKLLYAVVRGASGALHWVAGICLVSMMLLTTADVILRAFRHPILGAYEIVGFAGALVIGLSMPYTSWVRGHVYVDALLVRFSKGPRVILRVATRFMGVGLFAVLAWNLMKYGLDLRAAGEVSPTLQLKFYPVVLGFALAALLQSVVLICDLVQVVRGEHE